MLHIYQLDLPGATLEYAVRTGAGTYLDFATGAFASSPTTRWASLPAAVDADLVGLYAATLETPPEQWDDGEYVVLIRNADQGVLVGLASALMFGGDDAPVWPGSGPGGSPTSVENAQAVWSHTRRQLTADGLNLLVIDGKALPRIVGLLAARELGHLHLDRATGAETYTALDGSGPRITVTPTATDRTPTLLDPPLPG